MTAKVDLAIPTNGTQCRMAERPPRLIGAKA